MTIMVYPPGEVVSRTGTFRHLRGKRHRMRVRRQAALTNYWKRVATHDALTGLLNRVGLDWVWPVADATAVMLLDLDGFKPVNDRFGHEAGDLVLIEVARRLALTGMPIVRLGGDEFVAVVTDPAPLGLAAWLRGLINAPISLTSTTTVSVSASIGIRLLTEQAELQPGLQQSLRSADLAMYQAKTQDLGIAIWDPSMTAPTFSDSCRVRDLRFKDERDK